MRILGNVKKQCGEYAYWCYGVVLTKWQPHKILFTNNINKQTRKKNRHKNRKSCVLQVKRTELYYSATNLHRNWIHHRHLKSLGMDLKTNKTLCVKVESQGWFRKQRTCYVNACPKARWKNQCFFFFSNKIVANLIKNTFSRNLSSQYVSSQV